MDVFYMIAMGIGWIVSLALVMWGAFNFGYFCGYNDTLEWGRKNEESEE